MRSYIVSRTHEVLGRYINGNYYVEIWDDGTKRRIQPNDDADFIPAFAESCDVKITDKCDGNCPFCYEGCTVEGKHGELLNLPLWDTLHPFTELAINGNDLSHPQLEDFLKTMKDKKVIVNMTVNQKHCERNFYKLAAWCEKGLVNGLGISLNNVKNKDFFRQVKRTFPNAVIHTIAGITKPEEYRVLFNQGFKLLILGYKDRNRGKQYLETKRMSVISNIVWITHNLESLLKSFKVTAFDSLALEQLAVKESGLLSEEEWEEIYMGDDGRYTFYIDLVAKVFAKNSVSDKRYPLLNDIDEMFNKVHSL